MEGQLPTLDPGLVVLDDADAPAALYRLVGHDLAAERGPAYWVDARNHAAPAALERYATRKARRCIQIVRAFTGYQHYELVRSLPDTIRSGTQLVVAPAVDALYAEDDVPDHEADAMIAATVAILRGVATAADAPVLVTTTGTDYATDVRDAADRTLETTATDVGLRVDGETFRTDVYWDPWGFQTTIPYWVDLLGAVEERERVVTTGPAVSGV